MSATTLKVWRVVFGAGALFSYGMAWAAFFSPGDLRVVGAWAFVFAFSSFLALEDRELLLVVER